MTDVDWRVTAFHAALKGVEGGPPKSLVSRAAPEAEERGESIAATDLTAVISVATPADAFLASLGMQVHKWDAAPASSDWSKGTEPSTPERRALICTALGLDETGARLLLERRPIFRDETVVISAPWDPWYTNERSGGQAFYWTRYRDHLLTTKGWLEGSVTALDLATSDVVRRLADPTRREALQSKGLVVGYVQSGKTANFTGVAAKAIDAGYRLVIVMTGTIEMLRAQTQRRMDMEMVGRQNILGDLSEAGAKEARVDYQDDKAWLNNEFLDLGAEELVTGVVRLTQHHSDYKKQFATLKIERFIAGKPLYDPQNLYPTSARLAIVKKNAAVLRKLVGDIKANKSAFAEIPVLIIDDESDQASVNTVDPEKVAMAKAEGREIKERRAINEQIAAMLELMPRAQYVGYTATPFANVFVDPADEQGIFPRDFVIGLPRPDGYMGVDDFHDLGVTEDVPTLRSSNRLAFVRDLEAEDDDDQAQEGELAEAMDMFVLTGAVKRWRTATAGIPFPHHTMLIHSSVKTQEHGELAELVKTLWAKAQFSSPAAKKRLQELYDTDVAPVSAARLEDGLPAMPSFGDLATHIPAVISKVTEHTHNPVLVVNSDADIQRNQQALDFDRFDTWRILVGGAKLSRGFTVEGLTVTYFRRATNMGDSLTQMGRWFGFRRGYRDLVRLYIARHARFGNRTVDLYEAFESIALDEAAFRHQLHQYADWEEDGHPAVTPAQIPPLVTQHLPGLRPTANNKMFNAVLDEQSEQPFTPAGYANDPGQLAANLDRWRPLFAHARDLVELPVTKNTTLPAFVGVVDASEVVDALAATKYLPYFFERVVQPKLTLYRRLIAQGLLLDFLVVAPQPATELKVDIGGLGPRSVVSRDRRMGRGGRFGEITDAKHRPWAVSFVGDSPLPQLQQRHLPTRGVVLSYLVKEGKPDYEVGDSPEAGIFPAVSVYVPDASLPSSGGVLRFKVHDPGQSDAVIVEANVKA